MSGAGMHPYLQQQWVQPPPQPTPTPTPPLAIENPNRQTTEEVRTIFIAGLPEDVKERELQNLLRWLPGYEASQVNMKGEQPMGFALFSNAQFAVAARDALQDMVFDSESKCTLHTEMAKKNLFVKRAPDDCPGPEADCMLMFNASRSCTSLRGVVADSNSFDQSKRMRTGGDYTHTGYPSPSPFHPPPAPVWGPQGYMAPPPPPYDPYAGYPMASVPMPTPAPVSAPSGYAPVQNAKDNPPCNTLFIGNLGENTIEEELRGLFSLQPGFKQMKVLRQERNTVCFIEFDDVNSAAIVHQNLQGAIIPSSGRGGMRIQYSKNPFGRRKDAVCESNGGPPIMLSYQ